MKYNFKNDYSILAHPSILNALAKCSNENNLCYGQDVHSSSAANKIKEIFNVLNGEVFFVSGGTQANMLVISYMLKPYEAVLSCDSGHINVHETGAVEESGHKIITVNNKDGKLTVKDILKMLSLHVDEHMLTLQRLKHVGF